MSLDAKGGVQYQLAEVLSELEILINSTPTGEERNLYTEANILLMLAQTQVNEAYKALQAAHELVQDEVKNTRFKGSPL